MQELKGEQRLNVLRRGKEQSQGTMAQAEDKGWRDNVGEVDQVWARSRVGEIEREEGGGWKGTGGVCVGEEERARC